MKSERGDRGKISRKKCSKIIRKRENFLFGAKKWRSKKLKFENAKFSERNFKEKKNKSVIVENKSIRETEMVYRSGLVRKSDSDICKKLTERKKV